MPFSAEHMEAQKGHSPCLGSPRVNAGTGTEPIYLTILPEDEICIVPAQKISRGCLRNCFENFEAVSELSE